MIYCSLLQHPDFFHVFVDGDREERSVPRSVIAGFERAIPPVASHDDNKKTK